VRDGAFVGVESIDRRGVSGQQRSTTNGQSSPTWRRGRFSLTLSRLIRPSSKSASRQLLSRR